MSSIACDLAANQSVRRHAGTRPLIVERARVLPAAPGVIPAGRQMQEPQDPSQRDARAGATDRAQNPRLRPVRPADARGVRKPAAWPHGERESEQGRQLLDASLQRQDLVPKFRLLEVCPIQTHHGGRRRAEPPTRRQSRDAAIRREAELARPPDAFP